MHGGDWLKLGWRHPVWDLVRFFLSLRGAQGQKWLSLLKDTKEMKVGDGEAIPVEPAIIDQFFAYLAKRDATFNMSVGLLRSEEEALKYCSTKLIQVLKTTTKNLEHHQSSKAIIATVAAIVKEVCDPKGIKYNVNPQTRCAWAVKHKLHVSARNIDGAIEHLVNPTIIWEIKEYWGKTGGGSKMSDAVYECNLVGRELREFEEHTGTKVFHIIFLDGKAQWESRRSDLKRFIDLTYQGLIDYLFVGKEIETQFPPVLAGLIETIRKPNANGISK
jgi:hypothetical protein